MKQRERPEDQGCQAESDEQPAIVSVLCRVTVTKYLQHIPQDDSMVDIRYLVLDPGDFTCLERS